MLYKSIFGRLTSALVANYTNFETVGLCVTKMLLDALVQFAVVTAKYASNRLYQAP